MASLCYGYRIQQNGALAVNKKTTPKGVRNGRKAISFYVELSTHKKLSSYAKKNNLFVGDVVRDACLEFLNRESNEKNH